MTIDPLKTEFIKALTTYKHTRTHRERERGTKKRDGEKLPIDPLIAEHFSNSVKKIERE